MLRKFAYNKIFRTTGMLLLFLLLLIFPVSKKYSLEDEITTKTVKTLSKREIYLLDKDNYVARYKINSKYSNDKLKYAKYLIELLIIDGKYQNDIPNGFKAILPSDIIINDIKIEDDYIAIDLSDEFYDLKKEYEEKAIELITYNLTTLEGINRVYININKELLSYLPKSNIHLNQPFTRNDGINKIINLINYKDVNMTTIYYINKNKDYYYVPVTRITNDKREKIKIIIDELTSSHIYESNLMSFLNYNTKLIDYKIEDNKLFLNFNNCIYDDMNSKNILEEVIYSISLSVRDNYNVEEVVFSVDGNEITKSVIKNIE